MKRLAIIFMITITSFSAAAFAGEITPGGQTSDVCRLVVDGSSYIFVTSDLTKFDVETSHLTIFARAVSSDGNVIAALALVDSGKSGEGFYDFAVMSHGDYRLLYHSKVHFEGRFDLDKALKTIKELSPPRIDEALSGFPIGSNLNVKIDCQ